MGWSTPRGGGASDSRDEGGNAGGRGDDDPLGGVYVWRTARFVPPWSFNDEEGGDGEGGGSDGGGGNAKGRDGAFPPHLPTSYLGREESERLWRVGMEGDANRRVVGRASEERKTGGGPVEAKEDPEGDGAGETFAERTGELFFYPFFSLSLRFSVSVLVIIVANVVRIRRSHPL